MAREVSHPQKPILGVHPRQHLFQRFPESRPHRPCTAPVSSSSSVRSIAQSARNPGHDWPISERPFTAAAHPRSGSPDHPVSDQPATVLEMDDCRLGIARQTPRPPPLIAELQQCGLVCSPNPRCPQRAEPAAIYPAVQVPRFPLPASIWRFRSSSPFVPPFTARVTARMSSRSASSPIFLRVQYETAGQQRPREFFQILRLLLEIRRVWNDLGCRRGLPDSSPVRSSGSGHAPDTAVRLPVASRGPSCLRSLPDANSRGLETSTLMRKLRHKVAQRKIGCRHGLNEMLVFDNSVDNFSRTGRGEADQVGDGDFSMGRFSATGLCRSFPLTVYDVCELTCGLLNSAVAICARSSVPRGAFQPGVTNGRMICPAGFAPQRSASPTH